MKHYNIRIQGKVQGVFYRASTQDKAKELGLNGWVRNEPDGSVYAEAEGERDKLDQFIDWCKQGPPRANVENVYFEVGEVVGFESFTIKY